MKEIKTTIFVDQVKHDTSHDEKKSTIFPNLEIKSSIFVDQVKHDTSRDGNKIYCFSSPSEV